VRRWRVLVAIGSVVALAVGSLWIARLIHHSDITLARWSSIAAIVGLPILILTLLVGIIPLFIRRSTSEESGQVNKGAITDDTTQRQSTNLTLEDRGADHGSTYIEMHGGSVSLSRPGRPPVQQDGLSNRPQGQRLVFRAIRQTSQGESQEVEIFDAEIASQWILSDPWGSTSETGAVDDE
jgi:hypothetical protein